MDRSELPAIAEHFSRDIPAAEAITVLADRMLYAATLANQHSDSAMIADVAGLYAGMQDRYGELMRVVYERLQREAFGQQIIVNEPRWWSAHAPDSLRSITRPRTSPRHMEFRHEDVDQLPAELTETAAQFAKAIRALEPIVAPRADHSSAESAAIKAETQQLSALRVHGEQLFRLANVHRLPSIDADSYRAMAVGEILAQYLPTLEEFDFVEDAVALRQIQMFYQPNDLNSGLNVARQWILDRMTIDPLVTPKWTATANVAAFERAAELRRQLEIVAGLLTRFEPDAVPVFAELSANMESLRPVGAPEAVPIEPVVLPELPPAVHADRETIQQALLSPECLSDVRNLLRAVAGNSAGKRHYFAVRAAVVQSRRLLDLETGLLELGRDALTERLFAKQGSAPARFHFPLQALGSPVLGEVSAEPDVAVAIHAMEALAAYVAHSDVLLADDVAMPRSRLVTRDSAAWRTDRWSSDWPGKWPARHPSYQAAIEAMRSELVAAGIVLPPPAAIGLTASERTLRELGDQRARIEMIARDAGLAAGQVRAAFAAFYVERPREDWSTSKYDNADPVVDLREISLEHQRVVVGRLPQLMDVLDGVRVDGELLGTDSGVAELPRPTARLRRTRNRQLQQLAMQAEESVTHLHQVATQGLAGLVTLNHPRHPLAAELHVTAQATREILDRAERPDGGRSRPTR